MANGPVFPAFLKIEHQTDNSAKSSFLAEVAAITGDAQRRFEKAFDEVGRVIDRTSSKLNRGKFKLDLDVSGLRAATTEADYAVQKITALRDAAIKLAIGSNDTSRSTKTFIDALRAQTVEAERARSASYEQLQTYGRLQEAVSKLTRENQALAQSYRDTFMEQAKAENAAFRSQQGINATAAPGLNRQPRSARDSASVFEAAFAEQDAANSASQAKIAAAATEMQRLAQSADILRAQLDPAIAAQNRFNAALDRADELLKAGAIDQRTYGQAVAKAQGDLQESWRSLTVAQEQQQRVAKQGTSADQSVINSMRSVRVAGIQAGQQLQDMAVQFQMGTNASTIFAQQLPQLGFALSGLEGNANKTLNKIGNFATFLAGPWGAAILIAGVVLTPLIEKLLGFGDAADEGKAKAFDFSNGLNGLTISANEAGAAFAQLAQEIRSAIAVQGDFLQSKAIAAGQASRDYKALYDREREELQGLKKRVANLNPFDDLNPAEIFRMRALEQNQPKLKAGLQGANDAEFNATIALRQQAGLEKADPQLAVQNRYRREMGVLEKRLERSQKAKDPLAQATVPGFISPDQYQAEVTRLALQKDKDLAALKPAKKGPKGADPAKEAERAAKAAQRLGEFGEDAGKKIANIRDSFRDIPPEVERINKASRELDDIISDLMNRKPQGFESLKADAEALKASLADGVVTQALDGLEQSSQRQLQVQELLLSGRDAEATALQNIWQIEQRLGSEEELRSKAQALTLAGRTEEALILTRIANQYPRIRSEVTAIAVAEQKRIEAHQKIQELQAVFLDSTRAVRGEVEAILGGYGKLSDLGATLKRSFQQIQGKVLTEQIFGDLFRDMDRYVKDKTGIGSSVDMMAKETVRAGEAAGTLADEMIAAAQRIAGAGSSATSAAAIGSSAISGGWSNIGIPPLLKAPANENYDPYAQITVEGHRQKSTVTTRTVNELTAQQYFLQMGNVFGKKLTFSLDNVLGVNFFKKFSGTIGGALVAGGALGSKTGAVLGGARGFMDDFGGDLFGEGLGEKIMGGLDKAFSGAQAGAAVAGIGNALGLKMSNEGAQIGGALGSFLGPVGSIIGALGGGLIGKLFGGTKKGFAVASNGSVSTGGNSKQAEAAGTSAGALNESLGSIAKAFGSSLGNYAVSIGSRSSGYISVSASGSSSVADKGYKKGQIGKDIIYDGKDMEEALRVALQNAIEDGAIAGIKAGSKRLLSLGTNIDAQVEKALKFEGVFKSLRAIKDPMGAALDELNTEFKNLIDIFKEAGASTTEFGQLEELYGIKRKEAIDQVTQAMTASLKSLKEELTIGSDYFSLRDRKASALEVYNPLKARVAAGDTTAFDAFSDAARNLISIEREISGSTSPFFALLQEVTALSQNALTGQTASISAASASDSPFAALAAQNAATASAIDNQTDALITAIGGRLDLVNANLIAALRGQATQATSDVSLMYAAKGFW